MNRIRRLDDEGNELAEQPVEVSAGAADAGRIAVLNHDGKFDGSMIPSTVVGTGDAHYVHVQSTPSAEWVVPHGLNKYPDAFIVDSAGNRWSTEVQYQGPNQLTAYLWFPMSGTLYCN